MLHLRLSVDVKCPRHPRRAYNVRPEGCGVCQAIAATADLANRAERELRGAARLGAELRWKGLRITESERLERVLSGLLEKAKASKGADGPLLGPPGFVSPEFVDDLRELPPHLQQSIEEYAQVLEEEARTGKLGR